MSIAPYTPIQKSISEYEQFKGKELLDIKKLINVLHSVVEIENILLFYYKKNYAFGQNTKIDEIIKYLIKKCAEDRALSSKNTSKVRGISNQERFFSAQIQATELEAAALIEAPPAIGPDIDIPVKANLHGLEAKLDESSLMQSPAIGPDIDISVNTNLPRVENETLVKGSIFTRTKDNSSETHNLVANVKQTNEGIFSAA